MAGFAISGKIEGLAAIAGTLRGLPAKLQRQILKKALAKATKPLVAAARRRVPVDSGLAKKSIGRKMISYRRSGAIVAVLGPRQGMAAEVVRKGRRTPVKEDPALIGHWLEFGTKPHSLDTDARAPRGKQRTADWRPTGRKIHPGAQAHPFLRPAFDAEKSHVVAIFAREVAQGLQAALAKGS